VWAYGPQKISWRDDTSDHLLGSDVTAVLARVDISAQQGTVPVSSPVSAASTAGVTAVGLVNGTMDTTGQGDTGNSTLAWMPYTSFPSAALQVCTHDILLKYVYVYIYTYVCIYVYLCAASSAHSAPLL
jgi:hypothetical protein